MNLNQFYLKPTYDVSDQCIGSTGKVSARLGNNTDISMLLEVFSQAVVDVATDLGKADVPLLMPWKPSSNVQNFKIQSQSLSFLEYFANSSDSFTKCVCF